MTGKSYYITTLADWQRCSQRFAQSHWIILNVRIQESAAAGVVGAGFEPAPTGETAAPPVAPIDGAAKILALIEADEGVHLALEDDPTFEALPHPLAQKPISAGAQSALAPHGVLPGATTFDATEALARLHPLLKHRVF
jgi:hypothetical protein